MLILVHQRNLVRYIWFRSGCLRSMASEAPKGGKHKSKDIVGEASEGSGEQTLRFGSFPCDPTNPVEVANYFEILTAENKHLKEQIRDYVDKELADAATKSLNLDKKPKPANIKVPLPPTFSGEIVDGKIVSVRAWRQDVHEYLVSQNCPKDQRVALAKRFLVGHARDAYQSNERLAVAQAAESGVVVKVHKWRFFQKATNTLFGHLDEEQVARDALFSLVQTGSCEQYLQEFQGYVAQVKKLPFSVGELIDKFQRGLKPALRERVTLNPRTGLKWTDFAKFSRYACRVDAQMTADSNTNASLHAVYAQKQKKRSSDDANLSLAAVLAQVASALGANKKAKFGQNKQGKAYGGGRRRKPNGNARGKSRDSNGKASKQQCWRERLCFVCHNAGHQAKDCPQANKSAEIN